MSKKACPSNNLLPGSGLEQLLLNDGSGYLESRSVVEVVVTTRPRSGGPCTVLTRGWFFVYPYESSPGWYKLVKVGVINTGKG
jgi:hypothetical protein